MSRSNWAARFALALVCTGFGAARADTAVFINELHYDNLSTDSDEAVEIAGPAGTNLNGWQVVPYNGSNGTTYSIQTLSGVLGSNCGGYGMVKVPIVGLQNGSPDGIALVNDQGQVVQFLSYEGTFAATNGPAIGMSSVDIGVSEAGDATSPVGSSLQLTGSGSAYGDFTWQADSTATWGACNNGQTFGAPPDNPPSVVATTPANNATNVADSTTIAVTFSEPVTLGGTPFTLSCTTSGIHTGTVGGSGTNYSFDPDTDFASGETCTFTVVATQVTDQDGTPDQPGADYTIQFGTDTPPGVISTTPANGTASFPRASNLHVTFSEAVQVQSGWFSLVCNGSVAYTGTYTGGGTDYSINPDTDLPALSPCSLTVLADHVQDLDVPNDAMTANVVVNFTSGPDSSNYYAAADTTNGQTLHDSLHTIIKNHTAYPYTASGGASPTDCSAGTSGGLTIDTWFILDCADRNPDLSSSTVDIYKNHVYPWLPHTNQNREHTWPNSYGFNDMDTLNGHPYPPYTDTHMLYMSDATYNQDRSNLPYGNCSGCAALTTEANGGFGGGPGDSNLYNSNASTGLFEVWNHRKGDAARAVMYMAVRYDGGTNNYGQQEPVLHLTDNRALIHTWTNGSIPTAADPGYMGMLTDLLNWNDQDPPDANEQLRNETVFSYQGNRNPFIDHPEWARCVFANTDCPLPSDVIFADGFEAPMR